MQQTTFPASEWYPTGTAEPCLSDVWAQVDAERDIFFALQHPEWALATHIDEILDEEGGYVSCSDCGADVDQDGFTIGATLCHECNEAFERREHERAEGYTLAQWQTWDAQYTRNRRRTMDDPQAPYVVTVTQGGVDRVFRYVPSREMANSMTTFAREMGFPVFVTDHRGQEVVADDYDANMACNKAEIN
jgi:RNA polymerase-binding transcription factor DksA